MAEWMQRPLVALMLLALGMAFIPLNDAFIKLMSVRLPLAEITLIRGVMTLAILAVASTGIRAMFALSLSDFSRFFARGMCLVVAMVLFFTALGSLPLPTCVAIFFIAPLLITVLSVPFLGERIGIHRSLSVLAGMAGVMLIIKPGTDAFRSETLLVFGAALSYALFQIWTRRLKSVGNLEAMVTVQHVAYTLAAAPFLVFNFLAPLPPSGNGTLDFMLRAPIMPGVVDWLFLLACAVMVLFLSWVSSNAYRHVEASFIAPFEYAAIPFAVVWGILIWQDWPDRLAWAGMGLILAGGLYAVYRERQQNTMVMSETPMPASTAAAQPPETDMPGHTGDSHTENGHTENDPTENGPGDKARRG